MVWFDLLAVQGALKSLLQLHNLKTWVLWCSAFFVIQHSPLYMTSQKTIDLNIRTFLSKMMSLLFNMQSRFIIAFLPRRMHLLISWLQSPSAVTLEPKKIKSVAASTFPPSFCHEVMGLDAKILVFWMWSFKLSFSLSFFTFIKRFFRSSSLSAIRVAYLRLLIFLLAILFKLVVHAAWHLAWCMGFPGGSDGMKSAYNVEDPSLTPGLGRSFGGRNGNPLQYSCEENPMDRGYWWAIIRVHKKLDTTDWPSSSTLHIS